MFKQVKSATCSGFVALFVKVQVGFLLNEAVDFYLDYSLAIQYISKSITKDIKTFLFVSMIDSDSRIFIFSIYTTDFIFSVKLLTELIPIFIQMSFVKTAK